MRCTRLSLEGEQCTIDRDSAMTASVFHTMAQPRRRAHSTHTWLSLEASIPILFLMRSNAVQIEFRFCSDFVPILYNRPRLNHEGEHKTMTHTSPAHTHIHTSEAVSPLKLTASFKAGVARPVLAMALGRWRWRSRGVALDLKIDLNTHKSRSGAVNLKMVVSIVSMVGVAWATT